MSTTPAYASLCATYTRLHRYQHFQSLGMWDGSVNMPPGGNETRAAAMAELGLLVHGIETDPGDPGGERGRTKRAGSDQRNALIRDKASGVRPA